MGAMGRFHFNDLKKFVGDDLTKNLKTTFVSYEKKVQELVKDFDVKGKEAKKKGEVQIDKWVKQLKKSRTDIEKRVTSLVNMEANKLSKQFTEVVKNLRGISASAEMTKAKPAKKTSGKKKVKSAKSSLKKSKPSSSGVVTASAETVAPSTLTH